MKPSATRLLSLVALCGLALLGARAARAVPIQITYTDSPGEGFFDAKLGPARRACIEAVASNWANRLAGTVPIQISASMDPLGGDANSAVLGRAGPYYLVQDFPNAPKAGTLYVTALANQIAGQALAPGYPDIVIQYNSDVDGPTVLGSASFSYTTDGVRTASGGQYYDFDFYQTCFHEMGHGLGFFDGLSSNGSFSFNGVPTIYDTFLANGPYLSSTKLTAMTATQRATALIGDALYFAGTNARAAANNTNPRIFAPNPFQGGSSTAHLREASYSGTSGATAHLNELMTPYLGPGIMHHAGPIVTGVFQDMGWQFNPYTATDVATALKDIAGLKKVTESDLVRLQRQGLAKYPGTLMMSDVIRAARAMAGTEQNPYILGNP